MNANSYSVTNYTGTPQVTITFTPTELAVAALNGLSLSAGTIVADFRDKGKSLGPAVIFERWANPTLPKSLGSRVVLRLEGKPELAALVAEAQAALAEEERRTAEAVAALEPIGFRHSIGCDGPSSYDWLFPPGTPNPLWDRKTRELAEEREAIRKHLRGEDFQRIAEATGSESIPANLGSYGGWKFGPAGLAALRTLARERQAEKAAATARKRVEREQAEAEKRAQYADLECTVIRRGTSRGEEDDPYALVEVTSKETGEKLQFTCRNIFDFGYVVNPDGGVRPLTAFEAHALAYLYDYPPLDDQIRM